MANVFVNEDSLSDIADAIRSKLNVQTTYKPSEMAAAIESISGGSVNNQNKTVHPSSSQQSITADSGYTGLGTVTVKGVTVENLSAANIVSGVTVKIGDADDDDSIASVTGSASGGITPTGTKTITSNGTGIDVYSYASADVSVPNSYSAGDEGKVVSNGSLVTQTSDTVTTNDTYDTTLINSLTVNVSGGGGGTTPTAALALKAALESIGYLVSEFNVATADAGNYLTVPHALGSIPSMIIAFNSELVTEASLSGYQLGCASGAKVGVDDNENRTYTIPQNQGSTYSLFTTVLVQATTVGFPTFGTRSQYNFCNGATANSVLLRNSGSGAPTKMVGTKWFLAVK